MKKEKVIRATTVGELAHHYANKVRTGQNLGKYSYEGDIFCHETTKLARILDYEKKIVVIMDFNLKGSYGNGMNTYTLSKAFSDEWTILKFDRLSALYNDILTKDDYFKICIYHIKTELIHIIDNYGQERELITNPDAFSEVYNYSKYNENINKTIDLYVKKFKLSRKDILNYIYNENHWTTVRYKGWGSKVTNQNKIDKPIKFYLDSTKWHTENERNILEFKKWKHKYFNLPVSVDRYGRTYKQIYDNLELKTNFEERADKQFIIHTANILVKKQKEEAEALTKQFDKLNSWLMGDNINGLYSIPIHLRIKDNRIETTREAIIPFESGKKLFKLFNKIRQDSTILIYSAKPDEVSVGHYNFRNIEHIDEHWYVTVGCHKIRDTEIDLFINNNNLKDWL